MIWGYPTKMEIGYHLQIEGSKSKISGWITSNPLFLENIWYAKQHWCVQGKLKKKVKYIFYFFAIYVDFPVPVVCAWELFSQVPVQFLTHKHFLVTGEENKAWRSQRKHYKNNLFRSNGNKTQYNPQINYFELPLFVSYLPQVIMNKKVRQEPYPLS